MALTAAERGFVSRGDIPLVGLLTALTRWWEERHLELMAEAGFADLRRAHNAVIVNLPARGLRLTQIAEAAGISKQATAELVDDLVAKGYLRRMPDPTDRRAKIIAWAPRGEAAHAATMKAFPAMEAEMAAVLGNKAMAQMKDSLGRLFGVLVLPANSSN